MRNSLLNFHLRFHIFLYLLLFLQFWYKIFFFILFTLIATLTLATIWQFSICQFCKTTTMSTVHVYFLLSLLSCFIFILFIFFLAFLYVSFIHFSWLHFSACCNRNFPTCRWQQSNAKLFFETAAIFGISCEVSKRRKSVINVIFNYIQNKRQQKRENEIRKKHEKHLKSTSNSQCGLLSVSSIYFVCFAHSHHFSIKYISFEINNKQKKNEIQTKWRESEINDLHKTFSLNLTR